MSVQRLRGSGLQNGEMLRGTPERGMTRGSGWVVHGENVAQTLRIAALATLSSVIWSWRRSLVWSLYA